MKLYPTTTSRLFGVALVAASVLLPATRASHLRGFIINYEVLEDTRTADSVVVTFHHTGSWVGSLDSCPPLANESVPTFSLPMTFTIDGAAVPTSQGDICVLDAYDCDTPMVQCSASWNVTFSAPFVEHLWIYDSCCRVSAQNTAGGTASTTLQGTVFTNGSNNANPISAQQPVVRVCESDEGTTASFQVSGLDAQDGTNLTYSFAGDEASVSPPSFLTVDPSTGVVSGDTFNQSGLWAVQIYITDQGGAQTPIDFLVDVDEQCSEITNPDFLTDLPNITLADTNETVVNLLADVALTVSCNGGEVSLYMAAAGANGVDVSIELDPFAGGGVLPAWLTATTGISILERDDAVTDVLHLLGLRSSEDDSSEFFCFIVVEVTTEAQQSFGTICVGIDECPVETNPTPTFAPTSVPTANPTPFPTETPTPTPTVAPCPYDGNDGNLEINFPPLLDENNTHVMFTGSEPNMRVRILVPRQYLTAAFDFEGATNQSGSYDSEDLTIGANSYWTVDTQSDTCYIVYTALIPWEEFRAGLGGLVETRFSQEVIYGTEINIEVTKELTLVPETLLEVGNDDIDSTSSSSSSSAAVSLQQDGVTYTRVVNLKIPFEIRFDLEISFDESLPVVSDDLRVTAALLDSSVLFIDPDASPFQADAHLEFITYIPLPHYLEEASIAVDVIGLQNGLQISELTAQSACSDADEEFCVQYWRAEYSPEVCTLNGQYIATMRGACHPVADNCLTPDPDSVSIVMDITSDNFCGITQEVALEGTLVLDATECNDVMSGSITVVSLQGDAIALTEIVELRASPTLANSAVLTVHESGEASLLDYSATLVQPNQVDFSFTWDGAELRCDVNATVEVVVRVEYDATSGDDTVLLLSVNKDGAKLLQSSDDLVMASRVGILPESRTEIEDDDTVSSARSIASGVLVALLAPLTIAAALAATF